MRVNLGRQFLSIPGPTNVPDEVLAAMHRPAIDIYHGELLQITDNCLSGLQKVFRTKNEVFIYIANGHGAWEAAVSNVLSRGDKILVLESGWFAVGWGEMAKMLGVEVEVLPGDWQSAVDPKALRERLKADKAGEIKAVLVAQVDTASGVANDIAAIRAAMDEAGHDGLLMVDCVASLACMEFAMDEWRIDVAVSGAQKGLMVPPGLGFVAAGPRALAAHQSADLRTQYWDWTFRQGAEHYMKYCGTPPEHLLFGLNKALSMIFDEGLDNIITRHRLLAGATHKAVEVWARTGAMDFNIARAEDRSPSITTIRFEGEEPEAIRTYARDKCGVVVGLGIGEVGPQILRIGHMGHFNAPMLFGTLSALEMAFAALKIPHEPGGVTAAIAYLADKIKA